MIWEVSAGAYAGLILGGADFEKIGDDGGYPWKHISFDPFVNGIMANLVNHFVNLFPSLFLDFSQFGFFGGVSHPLHMCLGVREDVPPEKLGKICKQGLVHIFSISFWFCQSIDMPSWKYYALIEPLYFQPDRMLLFINRLMLLKERHFFYTTKFCRSWLLSHSYCVGVWSMVHIKSNCRVVLCVPVFSISSHLDGRVSGSASLKIYGGWGQNNWRLPPSKTYQFWPICLLPIWAVCYFSLLVFPLLNLFFYFSIFSSTEF